MRYVLVSLAVHMLGRLSRGRPPPAQQRVVVRLTETEIENPVNRPFLANRNRSFPNLGLHIGPMTVRLDPLSGGSCFLMR